MLLLNNPVGLPDREGYVDMEEEGK